MFSSISRHQGKPATILCFKYLLHYSSSSSSSIAAPRAALKPQNRFLVEYLTNSLGFSKEEAISASNKVKRLNPVEKDFNIVVDFLKNTGLNGSQIKSIVSVTPQVLFSRVDKNLKPKIQFLQGIGLFGTDLVKVLMNCKRFFLLGLNNHLEHHVNYLRNVLGSDEKLALALKRCGSLLDYNAPKRLSSTILLLQKMGFSNEKIARFIVQNPKRGLMRKRGYIEDIFHRVEHDLGIARESTMFYYGVEALSSLSKSTLEKKFGILRSFGWSDEDILKLVRNLPLTLTLSEGKMRRALDYFMKERGYIPDYLASHPLFFTLNLERRVKPRIKVLEIINEKELNTRKSALHWVLALPESKFVKNYVLPHKDILPDMWEQYVQSVGGHKVEEL